MFLSFLPFVVQKGQNNLAFAITLQLGDASACVDLLVKTQRAPEAALFARTYAPRLVHSHPHYFFHGSTDDILSSHDAHSQAPKAVQAWKSDLVAKTRSKIAATVADPSINPESFEERWEDVLAREEEFLSAYRIFIALSRSEELI